MDGQEGKQPSAGELRAWAYRLLGRREYSLAELDQRLRLKWPGLESGPGSDPIAELIDALVAENLLSDERFTESFVRSQVQRQQGPLKIRAALRARGIEDSLIARELDRHGAEWTALAAQWLERQHPGPLDFAARGKFYRRLLNRGFSHDQAMDAITRD